MADKMKSIMVPEKVWKDIQQIKISHGLSTAWAAIEILIKFSSDLKTKDNAGN